MFDTQKIGKKIAALRKQNNMTQFELADRLAISFQAVSNWERGNSMPDISKLPELAQILHTMVDDLLCTENPAVHRIMEGHSIDPRDYPPESISEAAQILRPDDVSRAFTLAETEEKPQKENDGAQDGDDSAGVAGDEADRLDSLLALFPFLSEEEADRLAGRVIAAGAEPSAVLPFISEEKADELALQYADDALLGSFLPFMTEEGVDRLALRIAECGRFPEEMIPFMTDDGADRVAVCFAEKGQLVTEAIPFLSEEGLECVAKAIIRTKGMSGIKTMYPFLSDEIMRRLFEDME